MPPPCTRAHGQFDRTYALLNLATTSVHLTALSLTCAAKAYAPKSRGTAVAAHTAGQQRVICNCRDAAQVLFGPGGSAAGPKPGRDSFSALLGGG